MCFIGGHRLICQCGALAVGGQNGAHLADDALHFLIIGGLHRVQSAASGQHDGDLSRLCLLRLRQRFELCLCSGNAAVQLCLGACLDAVQLPQQCLDLGLVAGLLFAGGGRRFFCTGIGCTGSLLLAGGRCTAALRPGGSAPRRSRRTCRGGNRTCLLLRSAGGCLLFPAAGRCGFICQFLQRDLTAEQLIQIGDSVLYLRGIIRTGKKSVAAARNIDIIAGIVLIMCYFLRTYI